MLPPKGSPARAGTKLTMLKLLSAIRQSLIRRKGNPNANPSAMPEATNQITPLVEPLFDLRRGGRTRRSCRDLHSPAVMLNKMATINSERPQRGEAPTNNWWEVTTRTIQTRKASSIDHLPSASTLPNQ